MGCSIKHKHSQQGIKLLKKNFPQERNGKTSCWMWMRLVRWLFWRQLHCPSWALLRKRTSFKDYIIKRNGNKIAQCSKCEMLKCFWDAHATGTESYAMRQLDYFKHVNMQEAHLNDYYTNRALSIARPLEVLMVSHDKMNHAKTTSPCFKFHPFLKST